MKRIIKYLFLLIGATLLAAIIYLGFTFPPIMAGMAAKTMCSCVHVLGRTPASVVQNELTVFPGLNKAVFTFHDSSSVSAKILWSSKKAIFRKGLGCTLLAQLTEEQLREQKVTLPGSPVNYQDSLMWPAGNVRDYSLLPPLKLTLLDQAIDSAFLDKDPDAPQNTLAIIVLYKGQIVAERYAKGFNSNSRMMGWSMTKSLTNALVGTLVKAGKLHPEQPAPVSEWQNDDRKNITLNDLMHASSGLKWNESYFLPGDFHSMFMDSDDKGGYAARKEAEYKPNEFFEYSSGTTNLISRIIRQTLGDSAYYRHAYENFFYKIGMYSALIEPDASGTFVGSSYGYATPRDWARFGLLFLNDGVWNNERILPEGWVKYSSTPASAAPIGEYGAQWWLNAGSKTDPQNSYHPGLPSDEFAAEGFEGQYVLVIPSHDLVVVRLGISHHGFDIDGLTKKIIQALPEISTP